MLNAILRLWNRVLERPVAKRLQNMLAIGFILVFFTHSVFSVRQIAQTTDEDNHYKFGLNILHGNAERFKESVMPISAWNALPKFVAERLPSGTLKNFLGKLLTARLMTILFACGVAYTVFHFSRLFYGFIPALFSLFLFIFDPNILAHSQLVTTDIFVTGALLVVTFCAWRYALHHSWINRILLALSFGLALITKYTAVSFPPLFFCILIAYELVQIFQKHANNFSFG